MDDGDYLLLTEDEQFNDQEIARRSRRDVDGYHRWEHDLEKVIQLAKPMFNAAPPDIFSDDPADPADVAWMVKQLRGADKKTLHDLMRFLTGSAPTCSTTTSSPTSSRPRSRRPASSATRSARCRRAPVSCCSST